MLQHVQLIQQFKLMDKKVQKIYYRQITLLIIDCFDFNSKHSYEHTMIKIFTTIYSTKQEFNHSRV